MEEFASALRQRLTQPLPGLPAQLKMAAPSRGTMKEIKVPDDARLSAVLILLEYRAGELHFPLIQRPTYPGVHSGQMAFPGGRHDPDDTDLVDTALREAREEISAQVGREHVIGQLTDLYIPPSNSLVTPVVAMTTETQAFEPDYHEVDKIVSATIDQIQAPENQGVTTIELSSRVRFEAPYFDVNGHTVWGATAMILSELLEIIQDL